jgi:SAM-dependent methyltransferase
MQPAHEYALGSSPSELERLRHQADVLGEEAHWLFDRLAVQPGWRVLDMGCGPRGVLDVLARRVGPHGAVTGLDASATMVEQARAFIAALEHPNIDVVHADATSPDLPDGSYDLVHARLLLVNLPPPLVAPVLARMVALARPGGLVAVQDVDAGSWACDPPHPAWDRLVDVFKSIVGAGTLGRQLPALLRRAGAVEVACDAHVSFCLPGHGWRNLPIQFSDVTRARALALGLATAAELDEARAALQAHLDNPHTTVLAPVLAQAWGRRPLH